MSNEKRERRKVIVFCDDVDCYFKRTCRGVNGLEGECMLDLDQAIKFHQEHGFTTCEVGLGEVYASEDFLKYIKYNKSKYKGGDKVE